MNKPFFWAARDGWYYKVKVGPRKYRNVRLDAKNEEQAYAIWMQTKRQARRVASESMTVADVIEMYVTHQEERVAKGQLAENSLSVHMGTFVSAASFRGLGEIAIADLKPWHVLEWLKSEEGWGATTEHHAAKRISSAIGWAKSVGRIDSNPIQSLRVQKGESRSFLVSRELYERLSQEAYRVNRKNSKSFARVLTALWHSGCRPSEIANIRIEHVQDGDLGMTWVLPKHKNSRKKKAPRVVYCNGCLRTLTLQAMGDRKEGPLFLANYGEGFTYLRMRLRFERMRKRLGVDPKCVLYSFRHTSITNMRVSGRDVATVAELHGTSIQMIQDHYGHLAQHAKHLHDSVNAAAAWLAALQQPGRNEHCESVKVA